jgi:sialate O-acetylesterase
MFEYPRNISRLLALFAGILFALTLTVCTGVQAAEPVSKPFLHPLFTDNMVLQRGVKDSIWGWTTPGQRVTATMLRKHASAVADAAGRWLVKIGPFPVGGPYTLTVTGPQTATVKNVLVGDVWICSGQSNMELGVNAANQAADEVAHADYPQIRLMTVPLGAAVEPRQTFDNQWLMNQWLVCTPEMIKQGVWGGFSAVGYYFGRELNLRTHIPIGLIHSSVGGTPIWAWMSAECLRTVKDFQPALAGLPDAVKAAQAASDAFEISSAPWWQQHDTGLANNNGWSAPDFDDSAWKTMSIPYWWPEKFLLGVAWFRKEITVPASWACKALTLHLGPIDEVDTTFFNGVKVGNNIDWQKPRVYTIPAELVQAGRNVITVRIINTVGEGGIYGAAEQLKLELAGDAQATPIPLAGDWKYQISVDYTKTPPPAPPPGFDQGAVTVLNNGMIAPLEPFSIKGAIWYQGEANTNNGYGYRSLLPLLIQDWRSHFAEGDFPFYIVQLPNYMDPQKEPVESDSWAELREAQLLTAATVPNTGMAVTIDIGEAGTVHPTNKQDVGRRLALIALATQYGKHEEYSGPRYRAMAVEGKSIRLTFDHLGGGMLAQGGKLAGFAIAGADKRFVWADATIEGKTIVVSAPQVEQPVAVRYDWANNPAGNLYNQAGLPASPFRTDIDAKP